MRTRLAAVLGVALAVGAPLPGTADEIVGALSQSRVALTANFAGSEILIFGAIVPTDDTGTATLTDETMTEEAHGGPDLGPLTGADVTPQNPVTVAQDTAPASNPDATLDVGTDVIVVIEGPREPVAVWRKERRAGIWVNVESVTLPSVPSFYAVAATAPLNEILSPEADAQYRISIGQAIQADRALDGPDQALLFAEALVRIRERGREFQALERHVRLDRGVLFRTSVQLPANLTEGAYTTRMFLVRDGEVINQFRTAIFVQKDGLEQWLHWLATNYSFLYGLLALAIALVAGWGASALFRLVRNS
ncbi:MAG: TIGR02186 family protein [Paracoccaceae bacterium]